MARTTSDCTNLQHCTSLTPLSSLTHLLCRGCNTAHNRHNRMFSCHFRIHLQCIDTQQCNTQFSVWCRARSPHPVRLRSLTHLNWARGRKVQFRWASARVWKAKTFCKLKAASLLQHVLYASRQLSNENVWCFLLWTSRTWRRAGEGERRAWVTQRLSITRGSLSTVSWSVIESLDMHRSPRSDGPGDGKRIPAGWLSMEGELNWTDWEMKGLFHGVIQSSLFTRKICSSEQIVCEPNTRL